MYSLDYIYKEKFFSRRISLNWRGKIVCPPIYEVFKPKSIVDVGCGNGDLLSYFHNDLGVKEIAGIEGTGNCLNHMMIPRDRIGIKDLRTVYTRGEVEVIDDLQDSKADIALCFEVAEHLEGEFADIFLETLISLSDRIIFSAAVPGQGGIQHVNCQPQDYWEEKFLKRDFIRRKCVEGELKKKWEPWKNLRGIRAFHINLMIYIKIGVNPKCST